MRREDVLSRRLYNQRLERRRFSDPHELVGSFCAIQAQDFAGAAWAVCQRLARATSTGFDDAFARGEILRIHVLRPTWHFVTAQDIRWMTDLSRPRLLQSLAYYFRQHELDEQTLVRTNGLLHDLLEGGKELTRSELATGLDRHGIDVANGVRLAHILIYAEICGLICSGATRRKQQTYALLKERSPSAQTLDRESSLAELALRYFTSHGPATVDDYAWWSGLTKADASAGLESVKETLDQDRVDDQIYWFPEDAAAVSASSDAHLLPNYDEYLVAYADRSSLFDSRHSDHLDSRGNPLFNNVLILDGTIAGTWKKTVRRSALTLEFTLFGQVSAGGKNRIHAAAERYAEYFEVEDLTLTGV